MITEIEGIDIYLLDQISKGRFLKGQRILDAGCGSGRNLRWFIENDYDFEACDRDEEVIQSLKAYWNNKDQFSIAKLEVLPYPDAAFDAIICSAVLHFAQSQGHFMEMGKELHRVLKAEGLLFIRMTSTFGLPHNYNTIGNGRFLLADGSERFLLTKDNLNALLALGFEKIEPVKSVLVEELRSMTTLVLRKK